MDARFEGGVFVPEQRPALPDNQRVHLIVETVSPTSTAAGRDLIETRRTRRIRLADEDLVHQVATLPEFDPNEA